MTHELRKRGTSCAQSSRLCAFFQQPELAPEPFGGRCGWHVAAAYVVGGDRHAGTGEGDIRVPGGSAMRAPFEGPVNNVTGTTQLANLTGDALLPTPSLGSFAGEPPGQVAKHACDEHENNERNKTDRRHDTLSPGARCCLQLQR